MNLFSTVANSPVKPVGLASSLSKFASQVPPIGQTAGKVEDRLGSVLVQKANDILAQQFAQASTFKQNPPPQTFPVGYSPTVFVFNNGQLQDEGLTDNFVQQLNASNGSMLQDKLALARQFHEEQRQCAGLDGSTVSSQSIVNAIDGLCTLAAIYATKDRQLKLDVLDSLIEALRRNPLDELSAEGLIDLAIKLMQTLTPDIAQKQTVEVQIKVTIAFGLVADLILRHYTLGHLNAITKELKDQLLQTAQGLDGLNTQDNLDLAFAADFALEGFKRLRSDNKALFEVLKRVGSFAVGVGSLYQKNIGQAFEAFKVAFKDLDLKLESVWFEHAYLLFSYAKKAQNDEAYLKKLLTGFTPASYDWRVTYLYMDLLSRLAIAGGTPEIRDQAYTALEAFKDCQDYDKKLAIGKAIIRGQKPKAIDVNFAIQRHCVECMAQIAQHAPESTVRLKAKHVLSSRLATERSTVKTLEIQQTQKQENKGGVFSKLGKSTKDTEITDEQRQHEDLVSFLETIVPGTSSKKGAWFAETGEYARKDETASTNNNNNTTLTQQTAVKTQTQSSASKVIAMNPQQKAIPASPNGANKENNAAALVPANGSIELPPKRQPHKIIVRLATCLGVEADWLNKKFQLNGISLRESNGLTIDPKGMEQIVKLIKEEPSITALDFTGVFMFKYEIKTLAEALPQSNVTSLVLDTNICLATDGSIEGQNDIDAAMAPLAKAIEEKSDIRIKLTCPQGYATLGIGLKKLNLFDEAKVFYQNGIEQWPKDIRSSILYYRRANLNQLHQNYQKALADFDTALSINPKELSALYAKRELLAEMERFGEAKLVAEKLYQLKENKFANRYNLAAMIHDDESSSKAELERALKLIEECLNEQSDDQYSKDLKKNILKALNDF